MTTMRVEKAVHKQIKDYCNQAGRDIGQWPEAAIKYLLKNHVDIFDGDVYIPFEEVKDDAVAMLPAIRNGIDKMTDIFFIICVRNYKLLTFIICVRNYNFISLHPRNHDGD